MFPKILVTVNSTHFRNVQLLSLGFQYVISAMILLTREPQGTAIPATKLAKPLNSPVNYLSQRLAMLIEPGILGSRRGLNGGVYLAKDPAEISLYDVVVAVEGDEFFNKCFLGYDGCGGIEPCPFHDEWSKRRNSIKTWLQKTTLADLKDKATDDWMSERLVFDPKK